MFPTSGYGNVLTFILVLIWNSSTVNIGGLGKFINAELLVLNFTKFEFCFKHTYLIIGYAGRISSFKLWNLPRSCMSNLNIWSHRLRHYDKSWTRLLKPQENQPK